MTMKNACMWIVLFLFLATSAHGGDIVNVPNFMPGSQASRVALSHLENKGLVAEFLDKEDTGIGKSVAYLLWREILTAISDQAGAGVIIAHPPGETRVVDLIKENYHLAAVDIATHQKAPMVLWGIAREEEEKVSLNTFLTLIPEVQANDLYLHITLDRSPVQGWEAEIKRNRFNFSLLETSRAELFNRPVITRQRTNLKDTPHREGRTLSVADQGALLQAIDMQGKWLKVEMDDSSTAYVDIVHVELPPKTVEAQRRNVNLRQGPGTDYPIFRKTELKGTFQVLDMRYRKNHGLWYKIQMDEGNGWVAGFLVRPRFSSTAVHFMAGLYRYRAKRYEEAHKEFEMFVNASNVEERNTNLATAYQLMGVSNLMAQRHRSFPHEVIEPFDKAVELTPYDPVSFNLRALARIGAERRLDGALEDLTRSLQLDARNSRSRELLKSFNTVLRPDADPLTKRMFRVNDRVIEKYLQTKRSFAVEN